MTPHQPSRSDHLEYLRQALSLARSSPPKPTNFRVGALLVSYPLDGSSPKVISSGYTLELPGNTHAEQCALVKIAKDNSTPAFLQLQEVLTAEANVTLYTTLQPCSKRLSGNESCVQRINVTRSMNPMAGVRKVIFGAKEPETFVKDSQACSMLEEGGVVWEYIGDMQDEILRVAMEGHEIGKKQETNVDDISAEERKRREAIPRNPKKRMMENPPPG